MLLLRLLLSQDAGHKLNLASVLSCAAEVRCGRTYRQRGKMGLDKWMDQQTADADKQVTRQATTKPCQQWRSSWTEAPGTAGCPLSVSPRTHTYCQMTVQCGCLCVKSDVLLFKGSKYAGAPWPQSAVPSKFSGLVFPLCVPVVLIYFDTL